MLKQSNAVLLRLVFGIKISLHWNLRGPNHKKNNPRRKCKCGQGCLHVAKAMKTAISSEVMHRASRLIKCHKTQEEF